MLRIFPFYGTRFSGYFVGDLRTIFYLFPGIILFFIFCGASVAQELAGYNQQILRAISEMPEGGTYAAFRKKGPKQDQFKDLYQTVDDLAKALDVGSGGRLTVRPGKAKDFSFCSSATYLLFSKVIGDLQKQGVVTKSKMLSREIAEVGDTADVIHGRLDGVGIFGHWNADGPGTAVLFQKLGLGSNFSSYDKARPGDFLKIFWNDKIGKGERGHLVVYLGTSKDGKSIRVWSSQTKNENGSTGYGTMWVEKNRIKRALFSRLEHPENLVRWLQFSAAEKKSDYLIRIRQTGSSAAEMKAATGAVN